MLTTAQLTTLKAGILAETDPTFVALRDSGATGAMADWLNGFHATQKAWKKSAQWVDIMSAIDGAKYTPSVANMPVDTAGLCRLVGILIKLTAQQNMIIGMQGGLDATDAGTTAWMLDTVTGVQSGASGATVAPGGAQGVNVANALARSATRAEALFVASTAVFGTVSAALLSFEGDVSDADVVAAINLP